jgi:predicted nuclease of predicted toxin-antitoxin system
MKLLLDENLSRRLGSFLVHDYPGKAVTLKLLLDYREDVTQALEKDGLGIVEL